MKKVLDFRKYAEECRVLAQSARNERERSALLEMAQVWINLATERQAQLKSPPISS